MQELDLHDMWVQEDGATCYIAGEFGKNFISRSGPVYWSPRSCDLTLLDYCLWGYVNAHDYTDNSASINALEVNIEAFIREIPYKMLERVWQN